MSQNPTTFFLSYIFLGPLTSPNEHFQWVDTSSLTNHLLMACAISKWTSELLSLTAWPVSHSTNNQLTDHLKKYCSINVLSIPNNLKYCTTWVSKGNLYNDPGRFLKCCLASLAGKCPCNKLSVNYQHNTNVKNWKNQSTLELVCLIPSRVALRYSHLSQESVPCTFLLKFCLTGLPLIIP